MKKSSGAVQSVSGKGLRIGIVAGRFNSKITEKLLRGATATLRGKGVSPEDIHVFWVPGAFEIPIALQQLARLKTREGKQFDALIALGAVVQGDTPHFDYVAGEAARGIMQISLSEMIPIAFGLLTTHNVRQALDRAGGRHGNKGEEAALVAIETAKTLKGL